MNAIHALKPHAHWGLRLSLAATFLYHGIGKFPVENFASALGMSPAVAWAVTIAEIVAGVALIAGAFGKEILTRAAGAIVIVIMIGAIYLVHGKNGFSVQNGGFEFQLLMLVTGLYFLLRGNDV